MKKVVKYVLLQGNTVLVEQRQADLQHADAAMLIPGGGIESFDATNATDPRVVAMLREVKEELGDQVRVNKFVYLGSITVTEREFVFYIYLITDWEGTIPEYIYENGKIDGTLSWIDKDTLLQETSGRVNRFIIEKVNEYLKNKYA